MKILGGWTIIQRRVDKTTDFWRDWKSYTEGFGSPNNNFWAGNDYISGVTDQPSKPYELKIDMIGADGSDLSASYDLFQVGPGNNNYPLTLGTFSSTGNGMF